MLSAPAHVPAHEFIPSPAAPPRFRQKAGVVISPIYQLVRWDRGKIFLPAYRLPQRYRDRARLAAPLKKGTPADAHTPEHPIWTSTKRYR